MGEGQPQPPWYGEERREFGNAIGLGTQGIAERFKRIYGVHEMTDRDFHGNHKTGTSKKGGGGWNTHTSATLGNPAVPHRLKLASASSHCGWGGFVRWQVFFFFIVLLCRSLMLFFFFPAVFVTVPLVVDKGELNAGKPEETPPFFLEVMKWK